MEERKPNCVCRSLAGQRFTSRDDKPYCAECFGELFSKRCAACSKPITGLSVVLVFAFVFVFAFAFVFVFAFVSKRCAARSKPITGRFEII